MRYFTLGYRLPHFLSAPLFGDRQRFGLHVQPNDPCWQEWEKIMPLAYDETQKKSVGAIVNNAGYQVMSQMDITGKTVLEIGPGDINHIACWQGLPERYFMADIRSDMLERSARKLEKKGIPYSIALLDSRKIGSLPFKDHQFDVIVSFYSLEHLYPLSSYLREFLRVLKPNGYLIGAIPCEGGLAWGGGRFLTSRRWFKRHTQINPDKIICWEHPNFADTVLQTLDSYMTQKYLSYWPLGIPAIDFNLIVKFVYAKS
ncbi:MAG TPA: hypothetical protein DDZ80_22935 [Cyanobacteria bacterium UBA8803]|nr:hypothetical protein [Cyanobacteria bacterium UBA9273]HBL61183.1 hypothetical protein [Cyanobacteria bacterium UBA8803]